MKENNSKSLSFYGRYFPINVSEYERTRKEEMGKEDEGDKKRIVPKL
jgi:hypothetical protein